MKFLAAVGCFLSLSLAALATVTVPFDDCSPAGCPFSYSGTVTLLEQVGLDNIDEGYVGDLVVQNHSGKAIIAAVPRSSSTTAMAWRLLRRTWKRIFGRRRRIEPHAYRTSHVQDSRPSMKCLSQHAPVPWHRSGRSAGNGQCFPPWRKR